MKLMRFLKGLFDGGRAGVEEGGVNFGTWYENVTPKGSVNRHRRRETATDASRIGHGKAQIKPRNWKHIKRAKRRNQKLARRANRYV